MPYFDLLFHNIQSSAGVYGAAVAYATYLGLPGTVNVHDRIGYAGGAAASAGWGGSVTGGANLSAMFLCETPIYANFHANFVRPPGIPAPAGFAPAAAMNKLCAFFPGAAHGALAATIAAPVGPNWNGVNGIHFQGTGIHYGGGAAPHGNDRYGIRFQARWRHFGTANAVTGVFVHTKNTNADPGTQIASLCRQFPNDIVFGDLNLDIRAAHKLASLADAVAGTHQLLGLRVPVAGAYFYTHYTAAGAGSSSLDYALVPNAYVATVEIWAYRPGAAAVLSRYTSDHSMMMLRIRVH